MRLLKYLALLLAGVCLLTSCSFLDNWLGKRTGDGNGSGSSSTPATMGGRADARFESVLEAIENEDAEAIRAMFSERALAEANDIDAAIEYLFNLFDGEVVSWERDALSSDESSRSGRHSRYIHVWYTVHTENGTYLFILLDYDKNTIDPDLEGLYTLRGINAEYAATQWGDWVEMEIPGVYMPGELALCKQPASGVQ